MRDGGQELMELWGAGALGRWPSQGTFYSRRPHSRVVGSLRGGRALGGGCQVGQQLGGETRAVAPTWKGAFLPRQRGCSAARRPARLRVAGDIKFYVFV